MDQHLSDKQSTMEQALEVISEYQVITKQLMEENQNLKNQLSQKEKDS